MIQPKRKGFVFPRWQRSEAWKHFLGKTKPLKYHPFQGNRQSACQNDRLGNRIHPAFQSVNLPDVNRHRAADQPHRVPVAERPADLAAPLDISVLKPIKTGRGVVAVGKTTSPSIPRPWRAMARHRRALSMQFPRRVSAVTSGASTFPLSSSSMFWLIQNPISSSDPAVGTL